MASNPGSRALSRRRVLRAGTAAGAALCLAACGAPVVMERVVVVPKVVERPVVTERVVIVERPVIVERQVVVTRIVTPPPTPAPTPRPAVARPEPVPEPARATLRVAISPAFTREGGPDLRAGDEIADLTLEMLDAEGDSMERLLARRAAGDLPDLLLGIPGGLVTALDTLEGLAQLDTALGREHEFLPEMLALGRRDRGLVGMPIGGYPTYLLANQQRIEDSGVADVGAAYSELGETAKRLTDPETFRYGFGVVAGLAELETVAGSAGAFPDSATALNAWQWYADQWLHERVSPPPSAWDGQGAADEALLRERIALAIAHGRALPRLAALPPDRRPDWAVLPLPAWPKAERRVPMAAAFIAAGLHDDGTAAAAAVALAGPAKTFDGGAVTPAWTVGLDDAVARLGLDLDSLLEARGAWSTPIVETAAWRARAVDLDVAVHNSLTLGRTADEAAAALQVQAAKPGSGLD